MPKKNIRYPPPNEKAPAIPNASEMHHSKTMHSLAHKSGNLITPQDQSQIPNGLVHQLTLHQNRHYHPEGIHHQLPLNDSISQKVAAAIAQGKKSYNTSYFESSINAKQQNPPINVQHTNKKNRPEKPNSLPVLNCLFAALNKQNRQTNNDVSKHCFCIEFSISRDFLRPYCTYLNGNSTNIKYDFRTITLLIARYLMQHSVSF